MSAPCEVEDLKRLKQRWQEARHKSPVPKYEDVAIGHLGHLAREIAIFRLDPDICHLRCGEAFTLQTGLASDSRRLDGLSRNYSDVITQGVHEALNSTECFVTHVACVHDGSAGICDFLFLPLDWKGQPIVMAWCRQRAKSENLLDAIYRSTSEGMLVLARTSWTDGERDYQIMSCNSAACAYLGETESEIQWRYLSSYISASEFVGFYGHLANVRNSGDTVTFELDYTSLRGVRKYLNITAIGIGELLAISFSDITAIKQREDSVRVLFDSNPIPNIVFDPHTFQITNANESALQHYGFSLDDFQTMSFLQLCANESGRKQVRENILDQLDGKRPLSMKHHNAEGRQLDVMCYTRKIWLTDTSRVLASIIDITDQREAEAKIFHMAHHDHLTGLANRVLLRSSLEEALHELSESGPKLAVFCIDLDDFKRVNDTLGHPAGDAVLATVSSRLRRISDGSGLVARLGGDEFAVVQFAVNSRTSKIQFAADLVEVLSMPYEVGGQEIVIGASVGVSVAPDDGSIADALLKNADIAMYRAKIDGKNGYRFFEPEMDAHLQARRSMEADLRTAIVQEQFELHFQPLLDISDGTIIGCEALIRWRHPELGMIPPSEFIPIAEETGLICQIGDWVLTEACCEAMNWPSNVKVAVNLSPVQFRGRTLFAAVLSALSKSRLPACRLELEITESVLFADSDVNREVLAKLRDLGISISLDDFGTGYSSLSYLRSFAFDKIKIDRSFISDIAENPDCLAIVRSVAMLGQNLGIPTLAEGVETLEQLEQLRLEGCHQVQGYLFSPPKPALTIREMLNDKASKKVA